MVNLTIFKNFIINYKQESLSEIFDAIKGGRFAGEIAKIRQSYAKGDKEGASELKKALLAFAPSARFDGERKIESITQYTGLIVLDFDNLSDDQLDNALAAVKKDPFTTMAFISPSGRGFKALVKVDTGLEYHKRAFLAVVQYFEDLTGCKVDPSGKDPARLCFLSYDPEAYLNESSQTFHVEIADEQVVQARSVSSGQHGEDIYEKLKDFTDNKATYVVGNRNNYIHQLACNANRWGVAEADIQKWVVNDLSFSDLGSEEKYDTIHGAYRRHEGEFAIFANSADDVSSAGHRSNLESTPCLPAEVFETLPKFFTDILRLYPDTRERDIVLLTLLTALGPCFPKVKTYYRGKVNYLTLFLMIGAPAGSGKSVMDDASNVINPLHSRLVARTERAKQKYRQDLAEAKKKRQPAPEMPPVRCLRIPANSSAAMFLSLLKDNNGIGYMHETEADTLVNAIKQDWGNFSDSLRKAFHHEPVSYSRKANSEYIEITLLRLSSSLSGTLDQVARFFQSAENGLVSRFMFYVFDNGAIWKPSAGEINNMDLSSKYQTAGSRLMNLSDMCYDHDIRIHMEEYHLAEIDEYYSKKLKEVHLFNEGSESIAMRYAVMVVRIASLLTWVKEIEQIADNNLSISEHYTCCDIQFKNAMMIMDALLPHAILVSRSLPHKDRNAFNTSPNRWEWFTALPDQITRSEALAYASKKGITEDVMDKLIKKLINAGKLEKIGHGKFRKV